MGTDMFKRTVYNEAQAKLDALDRSLAIIEFSMDGQVLSANHNFLHLMKYTLADVQGNYPPPCAGWISLIPS